MDQQIDTPFDWDDRYLLGYPAMDDTHREFVGLVGALLKADDATFPVALAAFAEHAVRHFDEEKAWMDSGKAGEEFPARDCHVDEHEKVLESVRAVTELVAAGDLETGRALAQALKDWFPGHADHMDSALSHWLSKRNFGGAPVVLKRLNLRDAA